MRRHSGQLASFVQIHLSIHGLWKECLHGSWRKIVSGDRVSSEQMVHVVVVGFATGVIVLVVCYSI